MALLEFEGFDLGHTVPGWVDYLNFTDAMAGFDATRSRTAGGRSAHVTSSAGTRGPARILPAAMAEGGFAIAELVTNAPTSAMGLARLDGGGVSHVTVTLNSASGAIEIRRGTETGTLLATSTLAGLTLLNSWLQLGVDFKIDDAAGWVRVYLNGDPTPVVEFDGDTRNGGTVAAVERVAFMTAGGSDGVYKRVDDWYLYDHTDGTATQGAPNDDYLGDCRVETERPNGNGAENDFVGSDGNSVDNYLLVDDDSTTSDYVGSATSGDRDLYTLTDLTPATGLDVTEVLAVQLEALVAKSDAGSVPDLLGAVRSSAGTVETFTLAAAAGISTAFQWFRGPVLALDPDDAGWTSASLDAAQAGVEIGA